MTTKALIKGNEAIVYGALSAGVQCYFGYPITPQNEVPELFSALLPQDGGEFVQAESEIGAANMLLGAASCGIRSMTSSSSPGMSLMQEAISYMAGSELPGVFVNVMRGGPGLGDLSPSQSDYFQSTRGGGHGDYRTFVYAPATGQECHDMTIKAFDIAFKYRNPVLILADAMVGQMKEPVIYTYCPVDSNNPDSANSLAERMKIKQNCFEKDKSTHWCLEGNKGREKRLLKSVWLNDGYLGDRVDMLQAKYKAMEAEIEAELLYTDDAELIVVAFGSMGRIARAEVEALRKAGKKVGLMRPQTLFPYPTKMLQDFAKQGKKFLVLEQNTGQMIEDVRLAVQGMAPIEWHGVRLGHFPSADDIIPAILKCL